MGRVTYEATETTVDKETGEEVQTQSSRIVRFPPEPAFVKLYIDDLSSVLKIPRGPKSLIWLLVQRMGYDGVIALTSGSRRRMAQELGIKETSFRNYLSDLCKSGVLKQVERGEYELNPNLFAKGDWAAIHQRRRNWAKIEITYDSQGERKIVGSVIEPQAEEQEDMFEESENRYAEG